MFNVHLKIKACKYEFIKDIYSLSARDKINSVCIYETDFIMDRILNDMNLGQIGQFLLNMFKLYGDQFSLVKCCEYYNGSIVNSCYFDSKPIVVSVNNIAISLPRKIREKYFIMELVSNKWIVNPDLYLMKYEENDSE